MLPFCSFFNEKMNKKQKTFANYSKQTLEKKWAGLARCANPSILFRSRQEKGLQMKALTTHLKCMQLIKYHILKYSVDEETSYIYGHIYMKRGNAILFFNELCRGQQGRHVVGFTKSEKRMGEMNRKNTEKPNNTGQRSH